MPGADSRRGAGKQATQTSGRGADAHNVIFCLTAVQTAARVKTALVSGIVAAPSRVTNSFGPNGSFCRRRPLRRCPDSKRGKGAGGQNRRARALLMHWRRIRRRLLRKGAKDPSAFAEKGRESTKTDSRVMFFRFYLPKIGFSRLSVSWRQQFVQRAILLRNVLPCAEIFLERRWC